MNTSRALMTGLLLSTTALIIQYSHAAEEQPYYSIKPTFVPYPEPGEAWSIRQYGPVGIGITLINPAFTIQITNVEEGSPAAATDKLKKGQIIESINDQTLKGIDPRVQLADILTEAEATDGEMHLKIKDEGVVTVSIPILGHYSNTWPLNCPKSDRIVRNFADRVAKLEKPDWSAALFMLSTGEHKDLEVIRRWLKDDGVPFWSYPWYIGYHGTALCEYYLRTGDKSVLPGIKKMCDELASSMYNGCWMGRGSKSPAFIYMAGGHMNAAGVHALNYLLLARQCGVEVDEYTLQRVLKQFFRFAGRGNVPYGDHLPEGGFIDNGKTAGLAVAMSSATGLTPEGEDSIYAAVRDNSAMKSFYATTWFNRAHTGGGIGEIWHGVAMQLLVNKKPLQHRSFTDARRWFYELSRRFDGSFSISDSGGGYAKTEWGNYFALLYTAPRKKLRMFGAPSTEWCRTHQLPERPWGTPADDVYQSLTSAQHESNEGLDLENEIIATHASGPLIDRMGPDASDELLWTYAHHPEYAFRSAVARNIVRDGREQMIVPLLKSKDPRVREVGVLTMVGMYRGKPIGVEEITDEMYALLVGIIKNPDESHWVALNAMTALSRLPEEKIIPHVDRILHFLAMGDWWFQAAALKSLSRVCGDERVYARILPAIGKVASENTACATLWSARDMSAQLASAEPEVQKLALSIFSKAYSDMPDPLIAHGGGNLASGLAMFKGTVSEWITELPGGEETMLKKPKLTSAWQASKRDSDKYIYSGFIPNRELVGNWRTADESVSIEAFREKQAKEVVMLAKIAAARKAGKKVRDPVRAEEEQFGRISLEVQNGGKIGGKTKNLMWSGDILVDNAKHEAMRMSMHSIEGKEYLFVETGGFSKGRAPEWKTGYYVMQRIE